MKRIVVEVTRAGKVRRLTCIEADVIRSVLELFDGDVNQAAKRLGVARGTLYARMKAASIDIEAIRKGKLP